MSLYDDWCYDINFVLRDVLCWTLLLGVCLGSSLTLLNTRLGVTRVVSTCCFFRAANGSWLSVSLKHTTFNTPPQWVGMMSNLDQLQYRKQFAEHQMVIPSIGILYHFPSYTSHGHAIDCLATDYPNPNLQEIEKNV